MDFALGAEARKGLRGWPEGGGGGSGGRNRRIGRMARGTTGGKTGVFYGRGAELRRAARGASLAGIDCAQRSHEAAGGPLA